LLFRNFRAGTVVRWLAGVFAIVFTAVLHSGALPRGLQTDSRAILVVSDIAKPVYLSPIEPPPFGTTLTRIAGDPGTPIGFSGGGTGVWNSVARHHYSNDEPWNTDQTLIAMDQPGGSPGLLFLDGSTYRPQFPACAAYARGDDRWHPGLPHARINVPPGGTRLEWFDVVQCVQVKAWALPFAVSYIGLTNGNVSADARLVALGTASQMFIVNMQTNRIGPAASIAFNRWMPTGFGVSPSGKYAWVHYRGDYNRIFDIDHTTLAITPHSESGVICHGTAGAGFIYDLGHQDVALNPFDNGEDVMIGQEHCGNVGRVVGGGRLGHIVMVRLRDGAIASLTNPIREAYAYHVSARATNRPGWVYVSYYEGQEGLRFNQELISVKMDGSQEVERWAHLHTDTTNCYECEAHPVPSRDGLRVIFASTWSLDCDGGCGTPPTLHPTVVQDYVVDGENRRH
jgi:hypothetical protein